MVNRISVFVDVKSLGRIEYVWEFELVRVGLGRIDPK
jgi:hypothetical protein